MSAPNTDVEKQKRRHKTPLMGMAWMIVWAVVLLIGLIVYITMTGNEPGDDTPIGAEGAATEQSAE
ncbi:hypothetical protein PARPLA_02434 [Rhodobacteraceae bacterium THAF1]|uniref:hypothetical protein n=1 Tax=Palleronia sp. THAF1 TaxID=2587842 RepID=UPI000F3F2C38|nr:hypothetical protein [Palleronia sp. THAF1]QFU09244.1 hypothetical protein FIU81_11220 [Palleronia sp. THAF1]VDC27370.1 hypothetical protein PARPLA_02434 [Rhodobacteraceae bacterium THAF1]